MLYICSYHPRTHRFGVADTDDGTIEFTTGAELIKTVFELGIPIKGVSKNGVRIVSP